MRDPGLAGFVSRIESDSPRASLTRRRSPSVPASSLSSAYSRPLSPLPSVPTEPSSCAARYWRGYTRRCAAVVWMPGMLELLHRGALAGGHASARGRRSRVSRLASLRSSVSGSTPSSGASLAAVRPGSLTRYGVAETSSAGSETASSKPWRSTIVPRRAGSSSELTCWLAAALDRLEPLMVPRKRARPAARSRSARNAAKRRPMRRSSSATGYPWPPWGALAPPATAAGPVAVGAVF